MAGSSSQNYDNADLDAEDYEREQKEARQFIEQNGITGFDNYITERVSAWKNMPLNIAVTGFTGVGKSTLINTFRVITPEDEGAAKTSTTECTHKLECYPHSTNKNLLFWDLPGT
jgi:predicted GTPase